MLLALPARQPNHHIVPGDPEARDAQEPPEAHVARVGPSLAQKSTIALSCLRLLACDSSGAFDQLPHYRQRVVGMLPQLRQLDFNTVTRADRANAEEFKMHPNFSGKGWRSHVTRDHNADVTGGGNVPGHPALGSRYKSRLSKEERRATYSRLSRPLGQTVDFEALGLSSIIDGRDHYSGMEKSQRRSKSSMA